MKKKIFYLNYRNRLNEFDNSNLSKDDVLSKKSIVMGM